MEESTIFEELAILCKEAMGLVEKLPSSAAARAVETHLLSALSIAMHAQSQAGRRAVSGN